VVYVSQVLLEMLLRFKPRHASRSTGSIHTDINLKSSTMVKDTKDLPKK